ncbi:MAG: HD-GYP domain-containing protein [Cellulosilyticaceae bacterium]
MRKLALPVGKCIPGMRTAEPIVNLQTGSVIVGQNQILTQIALNNLENFIHTEIWVYIDSWNDVWNVSEQLVRKYQDYTSAAKEVLTAPNITKNEINEIKTLAKGIEKDFKDNYSILGCVSLIREGDDTVYAHTMNVTFLAMLLARWMRYDRETLDKVCIGALLHDIGKIQLSKQLRNKQYDFLKEEYDEFKKHTILGYNQLKLIKEIDQDVVRSVLNHHERCDGSGYPLRLTAPNINKITKIIAIADEYDTLKRKYHVFKAIHIMQTEMMQQLDTQMVLIFCNNLANYYIGVFVELNNGDIGEVVFIHPECVHRPLIKIKDKFIDLYEHPELEIVTIE